MTSYEATVPANTSATLYLPAAGEITECEGASVTGDAVHNGIETQQIELAAGSYHFEIGAGSISAAVG